MTPGERVAGDPTLRAVVVAARAWGVSPSRFLGRAPVHRVAGPDGRTLYVIHADPEWTDEDRDLALALASWEADLCTGCNRPLAETTIAENEERYVAEVAARCHRCTALSQLQDKVHDRPHASALLLSATLRSPVDDAQDGEEGE